MTRLLYVWVKGFRSFENAGFNFSGKYQISHEYDQQASSIAFDLSMLDARVDQLFPTPIANVTAIVGKNGTGKSSILELVADIMSSKISASSGASTIWIAVLENEEQGTVCWVNNFDVEGIKPVYLKVEIKRGDTRLKHSEECSDVLASDLETPASPERNLLLDGTATIFYSPVFSVRHDRLLDHPSLANVSTTALAIQDSKDTGVGELAPIFNYRFNNIKRQWDFINDSKNWEEKIPQFSLPSFLQVRFEKGPSPESALSPQSKAMYDGLLEGIRTQMNSKYNDPIEKDQPPEERQRAILNKVKVWFVRNLLTHFFTALSDQYEEDWNTREYRNKGKQPIDIDPKMLDDFGFQTNDFDFIGASREYFSRQNVVDNETVLNLFDRVISVIDYDARIDIKNNTNESYFVVPPEIGLEINELYRAYIKAMNFERIGNFLNLDWYSSNLSSGEIAYLDLYSRLMLGLEKIEVSKCKSLFIIIDEGDLGFHPEWQREYLSNLLAFLHQTSSLRNTKVQLILASHSPFLVSDLPKEHVIFLERDDKEKPTKVNEKEHERTFAANIHTLFSDSFFIKSTMGEFAKKSLNELVKYLKEKTPENRKDQTGNPPSEIDNKYARNLINSVGEEVLRERLMDLFNRAYSQSLDAQIEAKEKELAELKRKRNAKN